MDNRVFFEKVALMREAQKEYFRKMFAQFGFEAGAPPCLRGAEIERPTLF